MESCLHILALEQDHSGVQEGQALLQSGGPGKGPQAGDAKEEVGQQKAAVCRAGTAFLPR